MLRWIGRIFLLLLVCAVASFAVYNRQPVIVSLFPLPWEIEAPFYLWLVFGIALGFTFCLLMHLGSGIRLRRRSHQSEKLARAMQQELAAMRIEQQLKAPHAD